MTLIKTLREVRLAQDGEVFMNICFNRLQDRCPFVKCSLAIHLHSLYRKDGGPLYSRLVDIVCGYDEKTAALDISRKDA